MSALLAIGGVLGGVFASALVIDFVSRKLERKPDDHGATAASHSDTNNPHGNHGGHAAAMSATTDIF